MIFILFFGEVFRMIGSTVPIKSLHKYQVLGFILSLMLYIWENIVLFIHMIITLFG